MWLFVPFVLVPIIEIGLFIQVGGAIGLWPTLLIVVITAFLGTMLVRSQGLAVLADLQNSMRGEGNPVNPIAHGAMIVFAGALLLTPGFFTDAVGFALLLPPVRAALIRWAGPRIASRITVVSSEQSRRYQSHRGRPARDDVVEGEYTTLDPDDLPEDDAPRGDSGWTKPR